MAVAWLAGGCTHYPAHQRPCVSSTECRDAFGPRYVCDEDGFCDDVALPDRCQLTFPADLMVQNRPVRLLGSIFDHSLQTQLGRVRAMELALIGANDYGGLDGVEFAAVHCDLQKDDADNDTPLYVDGWSQSEAALQVARFLVDELDVVALVGPSASNDVIGVFTEVVKDQHTVLITPAGTSSDIGALEAGPFDDTSPGMLWRTSPPDRQLAWAAAHNMRSRSVEHIVLVGVEGYGTTQAGAIRDTFLGEGGLSAPVLGYEDANDSARRAAILDAVNLHPEAEEVVFISSITTEMASFMGIAVTSEGFAGKSVFLSTAAANTDFIRSASDAWFGVGADGQFAFRTVRFAPPDGPVYNNFLSLYAGTYAEDASTYSFASNTFDAAWMVAYGSAWSLGTEDQVSAQGIARGLRQLSQGWPVVLDPPTWPDAVASLSRGDSVDMQGASGSLDYDPVSEETTAGVEVLVVVDDGSEGWTFAIEQSFEAP